MEHEERFLSQKGRALKLVVQRERSSVSKVKAGRCGSGVRTQFERPTLWQLAPEVGLPLPTSAKPGFILNMCREE